MSLLEKIWYYEPSSCLKCGSFSVKESQFCRTCFAKIYKPGDSLYCRSQPIQTYYLFNWIPQESDSLSFLLRHLKGSKKETAWRYYAKIFWNEIYVHNIELFQGRDLVLVPSPSRSEAMPDHAEFFCQNLAELSGIPMLRILKRTDNLEQKKRRKKDRRRDRLTIRENFSVNMLADKEILFVDDIVTTGGTALAAQAALGVAKNFTVWALASRGLGCE